MRLLNFRKADFQLFREIVSGLSCKTAQRSQGVEQSWQISEEVFHRAEELAIPRNKKSCQESTRWAWLSRERLVKLKGLNQMQRQWKQGEMSWEGHEDEFSSVVMG